MTTSNTITRKDARAYTAVAASDQEAPPMAVPLTQGTSVMRQERTWTDAYFDDKVDQSDLVAVFDVNYNGMKRNLNRLLAFFVILFSCYMIFFMVLPLLPEDHPGDQAGAMTIAPFFVIYFGAIIFVFVRLVNRQKKNVYGLHVAVTRQGIRKDSNHFPFASFFLNSTMMPYTEISKVFVRRICCGACGKGMVYVIAAADSTPHIIQGLEDPDGFVELVERMMEEQQATAEVLAQEEATPDTNNNKE